MNGINKLKKQLKELNNQRNNIKAPKRNKKQSKSSYKKIRKNIKNKRAKINKKITNKRNELKKVEIRYNDNQLRRFFNGEKEIILSIDESLQEAIIKIIELNRKSTNIKAAFQLSGDDNYYPLNERNIQKLQEDASYILENDISNEEEAIAALGGSGFNRVREWLEKKHGIVLRQITKGQYKRRNGAFLPYLSKINLDLSKYGIFNNMDDVDYSSCLIKALEVQNLDEDKLNHLKSISKERFISMKELNKVCTEIDIMIELNIEDAKKNGYYYPTRLNDIYIKYHFEVIKMTKYKVNNFSVEQTKILDEMYKKITKSKNNMDEKNIKQELKNILTKKFFEKLAKAFNLTIFKVGLIKSHYFYNEDIILNKFALENYEKIKNLKNWNNIRRIIEESPKLKVKRENRKISMFKVINYLFEYELFEKMEIDYEKLKNVHFDNKNIKELHKVNIFNKAKQEEYNKIRYEYTTNEDILEARKKKFNYNTITTYDFETYLNDEGNHTPYLVCWKKYNIKEKTFGEMKSAIGKDCALKMLKDVKENTIFLAHNHSFDIQFIIEHILIKSCIYKSNNNIISVNGKLYYKKYKILFKDSLKLIPVPLKEFSSMFKLFSIKEVIEHSIYTEESINKGYCSIKKALKYKTKEERKLYLNNIEKWNCKVDEDNFNHIEYSRRYCEMDVQVLIEGYLIFRELVGQQFGIDTNCILTISSLAKQIMLKEGCLKDVFQLKCEIRNYFQQAVVGGRTMTRDNKAFEINDKSNIENYLDDDDMIIDDDVNSLYPSAMAELDGFLKGHPKLLNKNQLNMDFLSNQSSYTIDIKILKINKKRHFSLMSDYNGLKRNWTNKMENKIITIDKISLEDLIEFHKIEFEIIRGYYFNEGYNSKIKDVIINLFELRKKYKKEDNVLQAILKLVLNNMYGKLIQKPVESNYVFKNTKEEMETYLYNQFNYVKRISKFKNCNKFVIENYTIFDKDANYNHVGTQVLAMSKRIMNRVVCLAEDNNIPIFYQDTDSLNYRYKYFNTLDKLFYDKYNRKMHGDDLCQFSEDFNSDKLKKIKNKYVKNNPSANIKILGKRAYYIGKKFYCVELKLYDITNKKIIKDKEVDYHVRMKGVNNEAIWQVANNDFNGNPIHLYKCLYHSEDGIEFDLNCTRKDGSFAHCNLRFSKSGQITQVQSFTRTTRNRLVYGYENRENQYD